MTEFYHMKKKTLVIGASPNPERYGFKATAMLLDYGHPVVPYGVKSGNIKGINIVNTRPMDTDFDTITMYLSPQNQLEYSDYIIQLRPQRVIFNPGTENESFQHQLLEEGIEPIEACTLVLLKTNQY